ncbi:uncharacterized protein SCHCODRAFT_02482122 [Schizophyllum commune H4-8]|nr:uncharacterized protein SCHCODRAFT_02482122 [Schizophyllum commune H4-8]KAI5900698.1 hypothetical protein SCHCODRAFT_02482122 [Schizophyllum commune H4-8]
MLCYETRAPTLPFDVLEAVVAHYRDDKRTLGALALVSSDILVPSRKHLFADVELKSAKQCDRLLEVFAASPNVAGYIRALRIAADTHGGDALIESPTLPLVLRAMTPNLRVFSLSGRGVVSCESIPPALAAALVKLLAIGNMTEVSLGFLARIPIRLIPLGPAVNKLRIIDVDPQGYPRPPTPGQTVLPGAPQLRHLELHTRDDAAFIALLRYLLEAADLTTLRRMDVICPRWTDEAQDTLHSVFTTAAPSLAQLSLMPPFEVYILPFSAEARAISLRSLRALWGLKVGLIDMPLLPHHGVDWLRHVLDTLPSDNALTTIAVHVHWRPYDPARAPEYFALLDAAIAAPHLQRLREVIIVGDDRTLGGEAVPIEKKVEYGWPRLRERGITPSVGFLDHGRKLGQSE